MRPIRMVGWTLVVLGSTLLNDLRGQEAPPPRATPPADDKAKTPTPDEQPVPRLRVPAPMPNARPERGTQRQPPRDPTRTTPDIRQLLETGSSALPPFYLRARVAREGQALGILEFDGRLYMLRDGAQFTVDRQQSTITIHVEKFTVAEARLRIEPIGRTILLD